MVENSSKKSQILHFLGLAKWNNLMLFYWSNSFLRINLNTRNVMVWLLLRLFFEIFCGICLFCIAFVRLELTLQLCSKWQFSMMDEWGLSARLRPHQKSPASIDRTASITYDIYAEEERNLVKWYYTILLLYPRLSLHPLSLLTDDKIVERRRLFTFLVL